MRNKRTKIIFIFVAIALLLPWPVAYGHDAGDGMVGQDTVHIEIAESSAKPSMEAIGGIINGVTPGDLFYIDATENQTDIVVTLHITNTHELIHCYRYMMFKVGMYVEGNAGKWTEATSFDGQPLPETFVTLKNGQASFILSGDAKYKVAIDGGTFNCLPTSTHADGSSLEPQFYLTVDQL